MERLLNLRVRNFIDKGKKIHMINIQQFKVRSVSLHSLFLI